MAPLMTLVVTYALARLAVRGRRERTLAGRVALSVMLVVTGVAHLTAIDALVAMVPPELPAPVALVYATGVAELVFALLLIVRPTPALGLALVVFFLAVLPANIYAALQEVGLGGNGPAYLWFRVPLQLLFIGWAAFFTGAWRVGDFRGSAGHERAKRSKL